MAEPDDELQGWFRDLPFRLKREIAEEIQGQAEGLADAIKAEAPVETGTLRDSVRVSRGRGTLELVVEAGGDTTTKEARGGSGVSYDYALGVEFGNLHTPAQPFFFSTYQERKEDIRQAIDDRVNDVLSRA